MIYNIDNLDTENNIDVFSKIVIYEATQFSDFDRFSTDSDIDLLLKNITNTANVLFTDLLPENLSISHNSVVKNTLTNFLTSIKLSITPQTKERQAALKSFNNKEVFILLIKHSTQHLYGTSKEPLIFKYDEIHSNKRKVLKGFRLTVSGSTTEDSRDVSVDDFNFFSRTLAFPLAQKI